MELLVTGAAGYLGSVLVPQLLEEGYRVIAVDNFMYNQNSLLDCCWRDSLTIIRADVRDRNLIKRLLKKVDAILPLACITGAPACSKDPITAKTTNFDAIKMILQLRSKNQPIIFPTTNSGYGVGQKDRFCTEESPLKPISLYGRLKVQVEKILLEEGSCVTLRFATLFGMSPRMRLDLLVNDFTYRAVVDRFLVLFEPHFKRNYLHVRDAARAFIFCLRNFDRMKNQTYNVGLSDANLSKWELCEQIKKVVKNFYFVASEIGEDPDKRNYIVSNQKIEKAGFYPKFSLQDGIRELVKGYQIIRKNPYSNSAENLRPFGETLLKKI
jgi:nucleoside-diphosphate-sugar epimerase